MKNKKTLPTFAAAIAISLSPASAQTLYWGGGTSDLADGTAIPSTVAGLTGNWTNTLQNWSSNRTTTVFDPWVSGAFANLGYYNDASGSAVLTVEGNKTVSGMFASLTAASGTNRLFSLNGSAAGTTLNLTGTSATFLVAGTSTTNRIEIGSNNGTGGVQLSLGASTTTLLKDGAGGLTLGNSGTFVSSDAFTGKVLIRSGSFTMNQGSSLNGTTQFDAIGYRPSVTVANANGNQGFTAPTLALFLNNVTGTSNRINDTAPINLTNRGTLDLRGGHATGIENMGALTITGTGFILNNQGTAGQIVNLASLSRGTDGRGTVVMTVDSTNDLGRHNIRITNTTGLTTDTLLPWLSTQRGEWLMIDSANNNQLTRVASTTANLDASVWDTTYTGTSNVRINGVMTNSLDASLALNSLSFLGTGTASNLNLGGNTLTLNAGALGLAPNGNVAYTLSNGTIQTPGTTPLYINTGNSNTSSLVLDSVLTGTMDIYVTGITGVTFGPATAAAGTANSYTGTVYVQSGTLNVNKDAAITGDVVVAGGGGLYISRAAGLAAGSNVTVARDGYLGFNVADVNIGGTLTLNGAVVTTGTQSFRVSAAGTGFAFNGGTIGSAVTGTTGRQLELLTNLSYAASSDRQAVIQENSSAQVTTGGFRVFLTTASSGNSERTFNIANSTTLAAGTPEMLVDVIIANGGSGSATGSILKTGTGELMLTRANTYTGGTTINGGTLRLGVISAAAQSGLSATFSNGGIEADILTFNAPITGSMAVGQTVTGTNISSNRQIVGILNDYQVMLNGTVGSSANQAQTNIALGAVSRVGSLAGNVTVNSSGTLLLDAGTSVAGTATVNSGGILAGTGTINGTTGITGSVRPGHSIGTLNIASSVTWNSSILSDAWVFELGASNTSDLLNITGDFSKGTTGGSWLFDFAGSTATGTFTLVDWTGATTFNIGDFSYANLGGGNTGSFAFDGSSLQFTAVPEPSTAALLGLGAAGLALLRRRKS